MKFFMMILYYYVINSASFSPNNLHEPAFNLEGAAVSTARSTNFRPNYKPPLYSDIFDLNPPSYEKAKELKDNEQSTVIQVNNKNIDESITAASKLKKRCYLVFKGIGLGLLSIAMITMMVFVIIKYY